MGPVVEAVADSDGFDDAVHPFLVRLTAGDRHREGDVLDSVEGRNQVVGLEYEADLVASEAGESIVVE